jgi:hypothetical protein
MTDPSTRQGRGRPKTDKTKKTFIKQTYGHESPPKKGGAQSQGELTDSANSSSASSGASSGQFYPHFLLALTITHLAPTPSSTACTNIPFLFTTHVNDRWDADWFDTNTDGVYATNCKQVGCPDWFSVY